mgnify:CR=1 FL=1
MKPRPQYTYDTENPKPRLGACPVCESDNTLVTNRDGGDDFNDISYRCESCFSTWSEIHQVTHIDDIRIGGHKWDWGAS